MLVKFQSDQTIVSINLAGLRPEEFLCEFVLFNIETNPSTACQAFAWAYVSVYCGCSLSGLILVMGSANKR